MNIQEMREAVNEAKATLRKNDECCEDMAKLISGRLKSSNMHAWILENLKRELRDFNIHTGKWK